MPITRVYQSIPLCLDQIVNLDSQASHHIARVLRAALGEKLILFNGEGGEYSAEITHIDKKKVSVQIQSYDPREAESPLALCLAQGVSRGEKMDYTIQKAVELGVKRIIPLFTERSTIRLDDERRQKRMQHWQSIAISACEQSGRNRVPEISMPQSLISFLSKLSKNDLSVVLTPQATEKIQNLQIKTSNQVNLLIGPEGGLTDLEVEKAIQSGFLAINLGPRILRTETAAVAALAIFQSHMGDG